MHGRRKELNAVTKTIADDIKVVNKVKSMFYNATAITGGNFKQGGKTCKFKNGKPSFGLQVHQG